MSKRGINYRVFILIFLMAGLFLNGCSNNEYELREKAYQAYGRYLRECCEEDNYTRDNIKYTLAFIDNDNIPEMVVSLGNSHATGVKVFFYDPEEAKVVDTGEVYGENGGIYYYPKQSCILDYHFGQGVGNECFCKITDDYKCLRSEWYSQRLADEEGNLIYYIDFTEVSDEEYQTMHDEDASGLRDTVSIERESMKGNYEIISSDKADDMFEEMFKKCS